MKWGARYDNGYGDPDIYKWAKDKFPKFMDEIDIIAVPLKDNIYNRAKSDIKLIESGSAGKPGVFADVRPYSDSVKNGENGYLAKNDGEWFKNLSILMNQPRAYAAWYQAKSSIACPVSSFPWFST